ncbi:hypothetical protein [Arthrobacter sp. NA-172]|uniref:hypothetical protein n=1 Tax=Arthrobacter sp. NA-172 TaxID=3367524 RepID=UPI003754C8D3
MKLESTTQRVDGDSQKEPDELGSQRNKHRSQADSSPQCRLPDPPDPDNLPIDYPVRLEYPGRLEIEWP